MYDLNGLPEPRKLIIQASFREALSERTDSGDDFYDLAFAKATAKGITLDEWGQFGFDYERGCLADDVLKKSAIDAAPHISSEEAQVEIDSAKNMIGRVASEEEKLSIGGFLRRFRASLRRKSDN